MTWSSVTESAKSWGDDSRSDTTNRNASRFIGVRPMSDGAGGIDFTYTIANSAAFYIENGTPISLRSTHNSPV